jgi:biotin synthase
VTRSLLPLVVGDGAAATPARISPEWVRISMASAYALRFRSGRFTRDFEFGGINLLLNYDEGCLSDCGYCGLARTRPGTYEDKSFIRVDWPLVSTDEMIDRMVRYHDKLTRLCISMVTHGHAYRDTCDITSRITERVQAPLSILVAPPTLNRDRLLEFKRRGVDMIGIGLDAVTEQLFRSIRTDVPAGGLKWDKYWQIVDESREIFGPWKVNVHTLVGLGEHDSDLIDLFVRLRDRQIFSYLFCFNPEPDSRMGDHPKSPVARWRRVQLARHLVEVEGYGPDDFTFDDEGDLVDMGQRSAVVESAIEAGVPFMTGGCPGERGQPGCTRPYGSYRPTEPFRDFPFQPTTGDLVEIRDQLALGVPLNRTDKES